jgi:hypothetical protein
VEQIIQQANEDGDGQPDQPGGDAERMATPTFHAQIFIGHRIIYDGGRK